MNGWYWANLLPPSFEYLCSWLYMSDSFRVSLSVTTRPWVHGFQWLCLSNIIFKLHFMQRVLVKMVQFCCLIIALRVLGKKKKKNWKTSGFSRPERSGETYLFSSWYLTMILRQALGAASLAFYYYHLIFMAVMWSVARNALWKIEQGYLLCERVREWKRESLAQVHPA